MEINRKFLINFFNPNYQLVGIFYYFCKCKLKYGFPYNNVNHIVNYNKV